MGLKSIFHLGEVFFWLASHVEGSQVRGETFTNRDLVTPWGLSVHHSKWNEWSEADAQLLRGRLTAAIDGLERFLVFIVPLRQSNAIPNPNLTSEGFRGADIVDPQIARP